MHVQGYPSRFMLILVVFCVFTYLGTWSLVLLADVQSEPKIGDIIPETIAKVGTPISTVPDKRLPGQDGEQNQGRTIKQLREENAKLKLALADAEVEMANLRTEIEMHKRREQSDRETGNIVLWVLVVIVGIGLLIRFTAPRF